MGINNRNRKTNHPESTSRVPYRWVSLVVVFFCSEAPKILVFPLPPLCFLLYW